MQHIPVFLESILERLPQSSEGKYLDMTFGGGGHCEAILQARPQWKCEVWDRDPEAIQRAQELKKKYQHIEICEKKFSQEPDDESLYTFILGDFGISSFQQEDQSAGMSLYGEAAPDFRMNRDEGESVFEWLQKKSALELEEIFYKYAEEKAAKNLAKKMKEWSQESFVSAKVFAEKISYALPYKKSLSKTNPATRIFQALRIAINDELGEIKKMLTWVPKHLEKGGRSAFITFHSLEDRIVKKNLERLLRRQNEFVLPFKKAITASDSELAQNPRSRSAKLRILEKKSPDL